MTTKFTISLCLACALATLAVACAPGPNLAGMGHKRTPIAAHPDFVRPPADAKVLPSGVAMKSLREGSGTVHPDAGSLVRVNFSGWRSDGTLFDSSESKGKPQIFDLAEVVRGLSSGIVNMVEGQVARFWIPAALAYGDAPEDPRLPAGPIVFEIELLKIVRP